MFDFGLGGMGGMGGGAADFAVLGLGIDASKAAAGAAQFQRAGQQVSQTTALVTKALGPVQAGFRATLGALSALGIGMAGWRVGSFITGAIQMAARFEELDVSLNAVGKNAGYSRAQLATLEEGLKRTGISATESRQQLLKMMQSQLDLSQATKLARTAQDVAVVGMLNSSDALARMTHGIVSGQTEVLRTIGLNVQFENSYKKLAKETDRTVASLTAQEKVQARVNAVLEAARPLVGLYEASMTSAGKQLRSTERYVQDLQVAVGGAFQVAYTNLVFGYADALKRLATWVKANEDAFVSFGIKSAAALEKIAAVFPLLWDTVKLAKDMVMVVARFAEFNLKGLAADFEGAAEAYDKFGRSWNAVGDNLGRSGGQLDAISAKWAKVDTETRNALAAQWLYKENMRTLDARGVEPGYRPLAGGFDMFSSNLGARATVPLGPLKPYGALNPPKDPETDTGAAKRATEALARLRESYRDLVASFRETTPLEDLVEKLATLRKEAAATKLPTAEIEQLEAAVLRAASIADLTQQMRAAREQARGWARELNDLAAVKLEPFLAKLRAVAAAQAEIRALETAANRAEAQATVRREVGSVRGQPELADRIVAKMQDFDAKQRLMQDFVGQGVGITEATAMAGRIVEAQRRVTDANRESAAATRDWLGALSDVAGIALGIASVFRDLPESVRQSAQGAFNVLQGAQQLRGIKDASGNAVGAGKALSGGAGAAAFASALSGVGAVVSGVMMVADAIDLFGTKARERARQMAEAARQFNAALDAFGQSGAGLGAVQAAIKGLTRDAAQLAAQAAAAAGATLDPSVPAERYVSRAQVEFLKTAAAEERTRYEDANDFGEQNKALKRATAYTQMAYDLERILDTLEARIRELAPAVMSALDQDFKTAIGDTVGASVQRATDAYVARLKDLDTLLGVSAITAEEYAAAVAKTTTIYTKSVEDIRKAERERAESIQRATVAFGNDTAARIAAANGNTTAAEDIRRASQYEEELREARAKGYDVTNLLIAQELEWAQVREARARQNAASAQDRALDGYVRDVTLSLGSVAGALAQAAAAAAVRIRELQTALAADESLTPEERSKLVNDEVERSEREQAALRRQYRDGFEQQRGGLRAELTKNPVEAAMLEGGLQMQAAMLGVKELFLAGIISEAEMAEVEALWEEKKARMVEMAREQAQIAAENFAVGLAALRARVSGSAEDRFAAFSLGAVTSVEQQIRDAEKLAEAGTITQAMFEEFAKLLRGTVAPAILEAAFKAEEAARILRDNMTGIGQQWGVFGADPNQQLADVQGILGFAGMTPEQIKALFTRITPGQELTDEQRAMNERIATFFEYFTRAQQFNAEQLAASAGPTATTGPGAALIRQLGATETSSSGIRTVTEVTATRLVDISSQQLVVQRRILAAVERNGTRPQPVSDLYTGITPASVNRTLGTSAGDTALLTGGVVS